MNEKRKKTVLIPYLVSGGALLGNPGTASAESLLAAKVLTAVSKVSGAVVTVLLGLITLATVVALVRSGLSAQLSAQFQRRFGLSREIVLVLETLAVFVLAVLTLPLLRSFLRSAQVPGGTASGMLGGDFHLPDF